jgi:hypothetical protein
MGVGLIKLLDGQPVRQAAAEAFVLDDRDDYLGDPGQLLSVDEEGLPLRHGLIVKDQLHALSADGTPREALVRPQLEPLGAGPLLVGMNDGSQHSSPVGFALNVESWTLQDLAGGPAIPLLTPAFFHQDDFDPTLLETAMSLEPKDATATVAEGPRKRPSALAEHDH